jgi:hypothetical protein
MNDERGATWMVLSEVRIPKAILCFPYKSLIREYQRQSVPNCAPVRARISRMVNSASISENLSGSSPATPHVYYSSRSTHLCAMRNMRAFPRMCRSLHRFLHGHTVSPHDRCLNRERYALSITMAMPCPTPMHIVHRARLAPLCASCDTAVTSRRAPLIPSG